MEGYGTLKAARDAEVIVADLLKGAGSTAKNRKTAVGATPVMFDSERVQNQGFGLSVGAFNVSQVLLRSVEHRQLRVLVCLCLGAGSLSSAVSYWMQSGGAENSGDSLAAAASGRAPQAPQPGAATATAPAAARLSERQQKKLLWRQPKHSRS
ncbi:hypothetical protein cyc_03531 [Cyclospora cayetanensis]|uniref:Uncharacterized protein n=1 Tax=Cyclospora cayetanensis TaxID=88456 RepID=A0A1D3CX26_9EIME|nr:hypothetical protein cyc_03531 [Cyclospora cayetanensis]